MQMQTNSRNNTISSPEGPTLPKTTISIRAAHPIQNISKNLFESIWLFISLRDISACLCSFMDMLNTTRKIYYVSCSFLVRNITFEISRHQPQTDEKHKATCCVCAMHTLMLALVEIPGSIRKQQ